jgi:Holliday junction DNA helicase RuvB
MANPNLHTEKSQLSVEEKEFENNIRPKQIVEFAGQQQLIDNLIIFIKAQSCAAKRLTMFLFHGPPVWVKTTLSR